MRLLDCAFALVVGALFGHFATRYLYPTAVIYVEDDDVMVQWEG